MPLHPERIVVGGELSIAGELRLAPMPTAIRRYALALVQEVDVIQAELSPEPSQTSVPESAPSAERHWSCGLARGWWSGWGCGRSEAHPGAERLWNSVCA